MMPFRVNEAASDIDYYIIQEYDQQIPKIFQMLVLDIQDISIGRFVSWSLSKIKMSITNEAL